VEFGKCTSRKRQSGHSFETELVNNYKEAIPAELQKLFQACKRFHFQFAQVPMGAKIFELIPGITLQRCISKTPPISLQL